MNTVYFTKKSIPPDEPTLKKVLGELYSAFKEVFTLAESYDRQWKYYGTTIGWQLKVMHKGKALFYLTPAEKMLRIGFALRENEKERLLTSNVSPEVSEQLATAKKYPEGYPLRLHVTKPSEMRNLRLILKIVKESRSC